MFTFFNKTSILNIFLIVFSTSLLLSHNLIYFFISWVGLNISLYSSILGAGTEHNRKNIGPSEVIIKYFIIGAMLTTFFLFTMVLFSLNYLTFDFNTISYYYLLNSSLIENSVVINLNLSEKLFYITIIALLLFKLGAFPFHFYLADVYSILCPKNTMFSYTITLKIFIFLILINILSNFWFLNELFYPIILFSAIGSIVAGSVGALSQYKLKQFFAYSYLNSIGFVLLAISSGISYGFGSITFYSAHMYFISYILSWFLVLLVLKTNTNKLNITGNINSVYYTQSIDSLLVSQSILFNYNNVLNSNVRTTALVLAIASLLGLPPTLGFYAKTLVYLGLMGTSFGQLILIITLVFTPIMAYSYLKLLIKIIYPAIFDYSTKINQLNYIGLSGNQLVYSLNWPFPITNKNFGIFFISILLVILPIVLVNELYII